MTLAAWWRALWMPEPVYVPDALGTAAATPPLVAACGHATQQYATSIRDASSTRCLTCHQFVTTHRCRDWVREPATGACFCAMCGSVHWSCERLAAHDHRADRVRELVSRPGF